MWISLGAEPVAALTEFLYANSTSAAHPSYFGARRSPLPAFGEFCDSHGPPHLCLLGGRGWWKLSEPQEVCRRHAKALSKTEGRCPRVCCAGIVMGEHSD